MIDEVAQSGIRPDAVVLSVGGGGLLAGVVAGLQRNHWQDVPVLAVETQGAASFHAAQAAGHSVELAEIRSIASSLGAKRVCDQALKCASEHTIHSVLVSDLAAVTACERFLDDHRILVEPACGASLAALYDAHPQIAAYQTLLVIVCGGATSSVENLQSMAAALRS
jgi:L-serine/L-threonine ammonia-lyase